MNIKPIETIYKGYRFRSRLEARWAVLLDSLGIDYQYEHQGFNLGRLGYYLPDFYLPDAMWFIEVKGNPNDEIGIEKARYLDANPPKHSLGCLIVGDLSYSQTANFYNRDSSYYRYKIICQNTDITIQQFNEAIDIAKQARFEHGEVPKVRAIQAVKRTERPEAKRLKQVKPGTTQTCDRCGNKNFHYEVRKAGIGGYQIRMYCNVCQKSYNKPKEDPTESIKYRFYRTYGRPIEMHKALIE